MTISSSKLLAHSELGPSAADRWINCPGSVLFARQFPGTDSVYAAEGTAAHTLSEWMRNEQRPGVDFIGRTIEVGEYSFTVDGEMADGCQTYVDLCEDFGGDVGYYELRVHYDAWVPGGFGTSDDIRIRFRDKRCRITDLKYGKGKPVGADNNPQNRLYALGVFAELGWLYDIDIWELAISQPRLNYHGMETLTTEELVEWANTVAMPAAKIALKPGAPLKAGAWCQFCPAKNDCPTRAKFYAQDMFDNLEDLDEVSEATVLTVAKLSDTQKYNLWLRASDIKSFLSDLETHGMTELQHGRAFGDAKLVAGRGGREYIDEGKAEESLVELIGDDAYTEPKLITPPQAEKKLGKKHEFMTDHVRKTEGKPVMVPGDDPRPPLHATRATEDFDDETGDTT